MKKLVLLLFGIIFTLTSYAQQGFNYKAIIDNNGTVLVNAPVNIQFTILENGTTEVYQENHSTTTNDNGIIIVNIGEGNSSDSFNLIDWSKTQFLKVEIDTGSGYTDFGTTAFQSVPYAKYAENGGGAKQLNALDDAKTGGYSTYIGNNSGNADTGTNNYNVGLGESALFNNTSGAANLAIGPYALYSNTIGYRNMSIGINALENNTGGNYNLAIGSDALQQNVTGNSNVAIGHSALRENTRHQNIAIGNYAGQNNINGQNNIFIGYEAGLNETGNNKLYIENSSSNTPLIGGDFGTNEVEINGSLAIKDGNEAEGKILVSDANGKASWQTPPSPPVITELNDLSDAKTNTTSTYLGTDSGNITYSNSGYNTAVGKNAMKDMQQAQSNVAIGYNALENSIEGQRNVALGVNALYSNYEDSNIAIGFHAGSQNQTGSGNVFLGSYAGSNETGSNTLYIDNSGTSTPLIKGDFSSNQLTVNGTFEVSNNTLLNADLEVTNNAVIKSNFEVEGNVEGKLKTSYAGDSNLIPLIFGEVFENGTRASGVSTIGFTSQKESEGVYLITFSGAITPTSTVESVTLIQEIGFAMVDHITSVPNSFLVRTYNTSGQPADRWFSLVVYKK